MATAKGRGKITCSDIAATQPAAANTTRAPQHRCSPTLHQARHNVQHNIQARQHRRSASREAPQARQHRYSKHPRAQQHKRSNKGAAAQAGQHRPRWHQHKRSNTRATTPPNYKPIHPTPSTQDPCSNQETKTKQTHQYYTVHRPETYASLGYYYEYPVGLINIKRIWFVLIPGIYQYTSFATRTPPPHQSGSKAETLDKIACK